MLGSIPHKKFCFYLLPTRGRAGIKLGDVDTSPTYLLFFIVPCCYIIILGCFIIILQPFYIIFGTNLLTQCQVLVAVFSMFFTSQEINIKQSPNATKLHDDFLWARRKAMGPGCTWGAPRGGHNPPERARRPRRTLVGCAHLGCPRTASLLYKYHNIPETLEQASKQSSSRCRVQNHQIQSRHHHGGVHQWRW